MAPAQLEAHPAYAQYAIGIEGRRWPNDTPFTRNEENDEVDIPMGEVYCRMPKPGRFDEGLCVMNVRMTPQGLKNHVRDVRNQRNPP
ncbi:hypothetical protein FSARC_9162 [Fusarium sarcochroum]|uniref:Uncharacterized protein n=1 Tax=Fusarium sarcochroum TaxID=1208366 RepID=A0A8H4TRU4_9HYPO|nr:hypothetical protein FSARC_9162 [Fusarium sarcochroum]